MAKKSKETEPDQPKRKPLTLAEIDALIPSLPPDDPLFTRGWVVGITRGGRNAPRLEKPTDDEQGE